MKKITTMDRDSAKAIRAALDKGLPEIAASLGLKAQALKATYDPASGTCEFKIKFEVAEIDGLPRAQAEWNRHCSLIGMKPEHFGQTFRTQAGTCTISGLDLKRPAFALIAEDEKGKRLIFRPEQVLRQMERVAALQVPAPNGQEG